jgi:hypothetical protein
MWWTRVERSPLGCTLSSKDATLTLEGRLPQAALFQELKSLELEQWGRFSPLAAPFFFERAIIRA